MKALKTVVFQVANKGLPVIIPVVQSDSARSIDFIISDMTIPSGATAIFYALKPDYTKICENCTITDNTIAVNLTTQTLAAVGRVKCQVQIVSDDDIVTTFEFALNVEKSLADDSAIVSANEFGVLIDALKQVNSLVTGVKGNDETDYRTGQINITLDNLGYAVANNYTTAAAGYLLDARAAAALKSLIDSAVTNINTTNTNLTNVDAGLTIASGFTAVSDSVNRATYNPTTKTITINFTVTGTIASGAYTQIGSILSSYAPSGNVYTAGSSGVDGWIQMWITSDGIIQCWHSSGTSGVRGTITYVLN
ncbi:MAG: BppU family phage baseplate upper protein [Sporomusa sp.]